MNEDEEKDPLISIEENYGSTTLDSEPHDLNDVFEEIGVGTAQYLYWTMISLAAFSEYCGLVVISLLIPVLRCNWNLSLVFEAAINCSVFLFYAISSLLCGKISDVYGRKKVLSITLGLILVSSILSALARNKYEFLIIRSVVGASIGACIGPIISFGPETVKHKYRSVGPTLFVVFGVVATFIVSSLAWLLLNRIGWRWFIIIMSLPIIPTIILLFCLPESPRYLCVSGQHNKAAKALVKIARMNNVKLSHNFTVAAYEKQELGSLMVILGPKYRKNTILLSLLYFANIAIEYGMIIFVPLAITSSFCGGTDKPKNHGCVEVTQDSLWKIMVTSFWPIFGAGIAFITSRKFGRIVPVRIFATILGISTVGLYVCFNETVTCLLLTWIKTLECAVNTILWIIIPEIIPTIVRTTSTGFISFWGKLGGVFSTGMVYLLFYLSPYAVVTMFVVVGLASVIGYFVFNHETKDVQLKDVN